VRPQPVSLSQLLDIVNERFGTDFNPGDQLFFSISSSRRLWSTTACDRQPRFNPGDKFELVFKNLLQKLFVERMDQNEEIFVRFMNDIPFQKVVTTWMASEAYRRLRSELDEAAT
jgi:type I restriction enzyme R subunit